MLLWHGRLRDPAQIIAARASVSHRNWATGEIGDAAKPQSPLLRRAFGGIFENTTFILFSHRRTSRRYVDEKSKASHVRRDVKKKWEDGGGNCCWEIVTGNARNTIWPQAEK